MLNSLFCLWIMYLTVIFFLKFFLSLSWRDFSSVLCDKGSFVSLHPRCSPDLRHSPLQGVLSHNMPKFTWASWCSYWPWYKSFTCKIWAHWAFSAIHSHLATLIPDCITAVIHSSLDSSPGCTICIISLVLILDFSTAKPELTCYLLFWVLFPNCWSSATRCCCLVFESLCWFSFP